MLAGLRAGGGWGDGFGAGSAEAFVSLDASLVDGISVFADASADREGWEGFAGLRVDW